MVSTGTKDGQYSVNSGYKMAKKVKKDQKEMKVQVQGEIRGKKRCGGKYGA